MRYTGGLPKQDWMHAGMLTRHFKYKVHLQDKVYSFITFLFLSHPSLKGPKAKFLLLLFIFSTNLACKEALLSHYKFKAA